MTKKGKKLTLLIGGSEMTELSKSQKKWNYTVEKQVKTLEPVKRWLEQYDKWIEKEKKGKKYPWAEEQCVKRARSYMELAILEIYNLQYYRTSTERINDLKWQQIPDND
jgi:hypothetical protein